jgi:hypothetical protein
MTLSPNSIDSLLGHEVDPVAAALELRSLAQNEQIDGVWLLAGIAARRDLLGVSDPAILGGLFRLLHTRCLQSLAVRQDALGDEREWLNRIDQILTATTVTTPNRTLLLHLFTIGRSERSLRLAIDWLERTPPKTWIEAAQVLSPLMQNSDWPVAAVFPRAFSLLPHPQLAAILLDLSNHVTRLGRVKPHPASDRADMIARLLGEVTNRLQQFEESPTRFGDTVEEVQQRLGEAVSLAISLCDALALIGDTSYIGKLNQTLELAHRRVQCEAAGALAALGQANGRQRLLSIAEEPSARLRAIQYADELGFGDKIPERLREPTSIAEAEMALWMSQPSQMGVPPTRVEVIDSRRLLWPSFNDPVDVYLVRFEYNFGTRIYSNVGITGPVVHVLASDVADLPEDDIYAIYAGWHAEHDEIFSIAPELLNPAQRRIVQPLEDFLHREGFENLLVELLGFFLDEQAAVFSGVRDNVRHRIITDGLETIDHVIDGRLRPLSANDIFHLYKGRKMLRTFNS